MIAVTSHMRILVARDPMDFRKGIDATAAICRQVLAEDPMTGTVFVFRNRTGVMVRLLVYDGQGFWLMTKRLSTGRFRHWSPRGSQGECETVEACQLVSLLAGGNWSKVTGAKTWRSIRSTSTANGVFARPGAA